MQHLINDILNTPWMIEHQYKMSMAPQIIRMVQGKSVSFGQPKDIQVLSYVKNNSSNSNIDNDDEQVVAVVSIKGAITKSDQYCGPKGTESINKQIKALGRNPKVAAIVLDMDTPGGQASFLSTLASTIKNTTEKKPVLAYYSGLCASAGYFIASACNEIYASEPTDIVGSIGTVSSFLDFSKAFEKAGIVLHEIYASQSTNKNKIFSEAIKGNYKPYQNQILDPFAESFINTVEANRSITNKEVFKGGTYMSAEAIELNLIDGIKSFDAVVDRAFELSKSKNSNTNNNQTNSKHMKKGIKNVANLLGYKDGIEAHEGHISLSVEDMEKINSALPEAKNKNSEVKKVEKPKATETDHKIETLEKTVKSLEESVSGFGDSLAEIKGLLGGKASAAPTTVTASKKELEDGNGKIDAWNDPEDQFNKKFVEDMGKDVIPSELGA